MCKQSVLLTPARRGDYFRWSNLSHLSAFLSPYLLMLTVIQTPFLSPIVAYISIVATRVLPDDPHRRDASHLTLAAPSSSPGFACSGLRSPSA